ncbi:tRNA (adenosine(37)-N6)-dimethylallyltransferase MiaA [Acutalibacter sp. 1XD8-33]|uniref:tRNA (adenosine(37)-N6)-dimethylallyltransferase MiaA n=1 Tax=Acutalibacter sp. 1XD8-33 TaxID=2320081 RepID=UPI000EA1F04D|nr:tRNA (adenosine(37)-N6)-dimethylallyltransferase MiaA [Acutalibacter sp. 1XD8-33]RKJ40401.1 tRNA (adenosine(37)-N6)-dimethylallyltransferase MiaA [Acutalibacter sp. 1XD8-33]
MAEKQTVVAITGPTATGKTGLAIALAKEWNGEIISCDSMQIYRGLEIGTAQPTAQERDQVPHHLIGFLDWEEKFSVSDYVSLAGKAIMEICSQGKLPILVGGTGLYARSLLRGFTFKEECRSEELREQLFHQAQELGPGEMHRRLTELDPISAEIIHPNNTKRVLRALEYTILSGEPFSQQAARSQKAEPVYRYVMLCPVFRDRQKLYERINLRVDEMLAAGLLEEAVAFFRFCQTARKLPTAAQSIGYKELFPYFRGKISLNEAVESIKQESRRYAKRQLTWFAREPQIRYLYMDELHSIQAAKKMAVEILREEGVL